MINGDQLAKNALYCNFKSLVKWAALLLKVELPIKFVCPISGGLNKKAYMSLQTCGWCGRLHLSTSGSSPGPEKNKAIMHDFISVDTNMANLNQAKVRGMSDYFGPPTESAFALVHSLIAVKLQTETEWMLMSHSDICACSHLMK